MSPRPGLRFARSVAVCGSAVALTGCVVFFGGWVLDVTQLKNVIPGTVVMKASTASALASLGVALLLLRLPDPRPLRRRAGQVCAVLPICIGLAFLSEYILGWNLGIDELPFRDEVGRAQGIAHPGRLAPTTAVCLVLAGLALLTLNGRARRRWSLAEVFAVPTAMVASMSLIAYTYAIPVFYGPGAAAKMAVNTAACFVAIAVGIVLARPHGRLLSLATTTSPGGLMARRLFPFVIVLPLTLGWLRLEASDAGVFGDRVGTWWLTATTIVGMGLLLWRGAVQLDRADAGRQALEERLYHQANHDRMTGLFNRQRFEEEMVRHTARGRRYGGPTAMLLIDLDDLKRINDQLGHASGDELLAGASRAIASRVRTTDVVGRLGGDEFGVLMVESTLAGAVAAAEDVLAGIRCARVEGLGDGEGSRASIGIAYCESLGPEGTAGVLARADQAMYEAKRAGGDRVACVRLQAVEDTSSARVWARAVTGARVSPFLAT